MDDNNISIWRCFATLRDPRRSRRSDARKRLELAGGRVIHVDLELRVARGAPRRDGLARAWYVDALAVVDGRGFVEHLEVGFPCHAAGGDQGVDDPRARGKPVHPWMGDRAADVHDGEWLRRVRRCWRVLDDRHRLSVAAMKARKGQDDDSHERDRQEDEDRSAHARSVSGTRSRA